MKASFVIPTYNCVTWLPHAVASAMEQSEKDIEIVIVDDGSTDKTGQYLEWLAKNEPRAKIIRNEKNLGRSESRNIGNKAASGPVILVLDADDLAAPNRVEVTLKKMEKTGAGFVWGSATVIDEVGKIRGELMADTWDKAKALDTLQNRIVHSTVAYRREIAEKFPYQSGPVADLGIDDWHQQIRVLTAGELHDFIPQKIACYRNLQSAISSVRDEAKVKALKKELLDAMAVPA